MRIVFLSYHYSPDIRSPEQWIERLKYYIGWSESLAEKNEVIRVDQINYTGDFRHRGIQYYFIDDGKKTNYFPSKLHRFVRDLKPDLVLVSSFQYPLQVLQLRWWLGKKIKIIIQHHAEKPVGGIKKYFRMAAGRKADVFLFTSRQTGLNWVRKKNLVDARKIRELVEVSSVFHPVDQKAAREKTNASGTPMYLWVGRLNDNKDPLTAVNAFLSFSILHPAAKLYMIYQTGELVPDIQKVLPAESGISPVILVGKILHDELIYWYNSADFYLSASHYEGSGTALSEAMSCGCIPLVTDIPSFRMMSGDSGLLFQPGNESDLLSALQQSMVINIPEKRTKALARFRTELSFEAIAEKFQEIIGSL
jgi:glycosyltransferase involved in cell wall biosynthesis